MSKSQNDGLNHQANMTLILDTEGMVWTYQGFLVTVDAVGYTSHSFNQFVRLEDDKMITIDQGDKYPRGVVMTIAAITEPVKLPIPPKTTITSISMDLLKSKASGFNIPKLCPYKTPAMPAKKAATTNANSL